MNLYEIIKQLCAEKGISVKALEEKLGYGNGVIRRWQKNTPSIEKVQKVADFFDVSVDYLLGRANRKYYELTEKDEKNISERLQVMIEDLENNAHFSKEDGELDENTKALLIMSLENSLRIAKQEAKKKFTPKKYRN